MNRRGETVVRRAPALLVLLAVIVAAGFVDHSFHRPRTTVRSAARTMPVAPPANALSSTWYCAGGTAASGGGADMGVAVANAGDATRSGTVTFVPNQGDAKSVPVTIPAASRVVLRAQDFVKAPFMAATVELDGGAAAAEVAVVGPLGDSATACASSASDHWYFAEGSTTKDAAETLFLFNPFPEDAIVDLAFASEDGRSAPQGLQGLAVRGRGLVAVNVGDFVHRRQAVSSEIATRVGRIVVSRLQTFDGTGPGHKGQSLALGAPATASREASAESRGDDIRDYHTLAAAIGRQLGTMHTVLARPSGSYVVSDCTAPLGVCSSDVMGRPRPSKSTLDCLFTDAVILVERSTSVGLG